MGRIVIAAYRPKPGREKALDTLMRRHHERLRIEGLVSDRQPTLMRAQDGTVIGVFEWLSAEAVAASHSNRAVQQMWDDYAEVCDYIRLDQMTEAHRIFADFEPIEDRALHPAFSP